MPEPEHADTRNECCEKIRRNSFSLQFICDIDYCLLFANSCKAIWLLILCYAIIFNFFRHKFPSTIQLNIPVRKRLIAEGSEIYSFQSGIYLHNCKLSIYDEIEKHLSPVFLLIFSFFFIFFCISFTICVDVIHPVQSIRRLTTSLREKPFYFFCVGRFAALLLALDSYAIAIWFCESHSLSLHFKCNLPTIIYSNVLHSRYFSP